jgi:hypothetical protein
MSSSHLSKVSEVSWEAHFDSKGDPIGVEPVEEFGMH